MMCSLLTTRISLTPNQKYPVLLFCSSSVGGSCASRRLRHVFQAAAKDGSDQTAALAPKTPAGATATVTK
jgi:hypothetical protein